MITSLMNWLTIQEAALSASIQVITKLGVDDASDGCAAIRRDFDTMEKWANRNLVQFKKGKSLFLPQGRNSPRYLHMLGSG